MENIQDVIHNCDELGRSLIKSHYVIFKSFFILPTIHTPY